jgi:HEPN domain-containing protein
MMNKNDHIEYWKKLATEDLSTAKYNLSGGKHLMALFLFHLSIEKILKALWVKSNVLNTPPFTHDLHKLSSEASLTLSADYYDYLSVIKDWNIETRYPDYQFTLQKLATKEYLNYHLIKVETLFQWLLSQL